MTTEKDILSKLTAAVGESASRFYTEAELNRFVKFYLDKWDENTSEDIVAESLIDYYWEKVKVRRCSVCGKLTDNGFALEGNLDLTYCSEKCLYSDFNSLSDWEQYCKETQREHVF